VLAAAQGGDVGGGADRPVRKSRSIESLGGVLSDVVCDRLGGQRLSGAGQSVDVSDGPDVSLGPEPQDTSQRGVVSRDRGSVITDRVYGGADGLVEQLVGVAPWRGPMTVTRSVQPDDRVVVDDAAMLVFGDLDEPDPDLAAELALGDPGQAGELAGQVDGEPAPQLGASALNSTCPV